MRPGKKGAGSKKVVVLRCEICGERQELDAREVSSDTDIRCPRCWRPMTIMFVSNDDRSDL